MIVVLLPQNATGTIPEAETKTRESNSRALCLSRAWYPHDNGRAVHTVVCAALVLDADGEPGEVLVVRDLQSARDARICTQYAQLLSQSITPIAAFLSLLHRR